MARERIDVYVSDDVAPGGTSVTNLPSVPNGQTWRLARFGGAASAAALIALQIQTSSGWQTMRATAGPGQADDFLIDRDYTGDGVVDFRIVRVNNHTASQPIVAWLEAYKRI